jgi:acetyl esterase
LPPTLIQTAEFDPLRDEGVAYGQSLSRANIHVTLQERAGLIHGYFGMGPSVGAARAAIADAAKWLGETILNR